MGSLADRIGTSMSSGRITNQTIAERTHNVNRRLLHTGHQVLVERRNDGYGLDEFRPDDPFVRIRTLTFGTKREVADFLHAMMVGIDLSRLEEGGGHAVFGPMYGGLRDYVSAEVES